MPWKPAGFRSVSVRVLSVAVLSTAALAAYAEVIEDIATPTPQRLEQPNAPSDLHGGCADEPRGFFEALLCP